MINKLCWLERNRTSFSVGTKNAVTNTIKGWPWGWLMITMSKGKADCIFSKILVNDDLKPVGSWKFSWSFIFCKILWLRGETGEGPGHFCMFGSYESTFYRWTATFYGMKLSRHVKKLLSFEGRPSDIFSVETRNLVKIWCFWSIFFSFLTLDAQKFVQMVESDEF